MKRVLVTALILLGTCSLLSAQSYFEGEIIYKNSYESKAPNVTNEQMEMALGTRQEYFIKDGNYLSRLNGLSLREQLYDSKTNRLYHKMPVSDTLYWLDGSLDMDPVISSELVKNAENVLGNECDALVVKTKNGTATFYFSSKYKIKAELYTKHIFGSWAHFVGKCGAVPLKSVIENSHFKSVSIATEIKPMPLEDNYFKIAPGTPVKPIQ
jgi:hypothetical protein